MWKICIQNPFDNCDKIHPLQQRKVKKLLDILSCNDNIIKVIIFGSSVTSRCNICSDVDIYIELKNKQKNIINEYVDFVYDLWTNFSVDERLFKEIRNKGVIVYERNIVNESKTQS